MKFTKARLPGLYVVELQPHLDPRGFFARTFCAREFEQHGLVTQFVQCSTSLSTKTGTIRGLHCQLPPASETKLVRCTSGAVFDVVVDLRADSPSYLDHFTIELSAKNRIALYVPAGFAHGFQTLEDYSEVFYQISEFYQPEASAGLRHDDPRLGIRWPLAVSSISEKDLHWALLSNTGLP